MNAVHNLLFDDDNDAEAPGGETSVASQARPHGLQATAQEHAIYAPSPLVHSQPPAPLAAPTPDRAPAAPPPSAAAVAVQPSERNPSSGHTLLSDAVKSGKITQEEAVLLNKTLSEAKVRAG